MKKQNSVQLRWLKLERTVNVFELSEFRATEVPQFQREKNLVLVRDSFITPW